MSPTLNVNPTLFVITCKKIGGIHIFTKLQLLSIIEWFFIRLLIIHDNISSQVHYHLIHTREGRVLDQWMNSSIIHHPWQCFVHLFRSSVIQKGYRSDIEYHTTLNTIFSVVVVIIKARSPSETRPKKAKWNRQLLVVVAEYKQTIWPFGDDNHCVRFTLIHENVGLGHLLTYFSMIIKTFRS